LGGRNSEKEKFGRKLPALETGELIFQLAACMVVSKNGNGRLEREENLNGSKI